MQLSITTDYVTDHGDPEPYLRKIAEAGFTHLHWCHHWLSDFLYASSEIEQIGRWLKEFDLAVLDVHGSEGIEKFWYSPHDYARRAGVELVKNRIDFTAQLGGDAVVMHAYPPTTAPAYAPFNDLAWDLLRRSLDELAPYARERGIRIAIENLVDFPGVAAGATTFAQAADNWPLISRLCATYAPDFLGVCYDPGHGNLGGDRMDGLMPLLDRLIVLHLNENDGRGDQHHLLFSDNVDWARLARLVARSAYNKPMSMEVSIKASGIDDETEFLAQAYATGQKFAEMVDAARAGTV